MIKVMVDTNVFLNYFFKIDENKLSLIENLFKESLNKKIQIIITTRILDEIIFKSIILASGTNVKKLKLNKENMKKFGYIVEKIFNFIKEFNIKIIEITLNHYKKLKNCIVEYGLFPNDCLTLIVMNSLNLKYIATFDKDFKNIDWIKNFLEVD